MCDGIRRNGPQLIIDSAPFSFIDDASVSLFARTFFVVKIGADATTVVNKLLVLFVLLIPRKLSKVTTDVPFGDQVVFNTTAT